MEENQGWTLFQKIKLSLKEHRIKTLIVGGLFFLLILFFFIDLFVLNKKISPVVLEDELSKYSSVKIENGVSYISINSEKGYLYKTDKEGLDGIKNFIKNNPKYRDGIELLPKNFDKNTSVVKEQKDNKEVYLTKNNVILNNEHYVFDQKINDVPVYGGSLMVHLKNKNEIYAIIGNLIYNNQTTKEILTQKEVQEVAVNEAGEDSGMPNKLNVTPFGKYIINKKLLGISNDNVNYLTYSFVISAGDPPFFSKQYFIDFETGKVVYEEDKVIELLDRQINNCNNTTSCQMTRSEGQAESAIPDVDNAYNILGLIYNYYYNSFGRDSFNNQGSKIIANVNHPMNGKCPNASWSGTSNQMYFCPSMAVLDVTAHELTHAVTQYTANLVYKYQSGALNESMSDVFASNIDGNWTMGEDTGRVIRDMSDPTLKSQPDRLFSANYYCGTSDNGGVHYNNGVLNKAYYLMADGGSFNGCLINGVGRQVAGGIVYRALTTYLSQSANFKSLYTAVIQSCTDLYGIESNNCAEVKKALQATEMDQQPDGEQSGAKCLGQQSMIPECAGGPPSTGSTITTTSTIATTSTTGPISGGTDIPRKVFGNVYEDVNNNGQKDSQDKNFAGATLALYGLSSPSYVTQADGNFSFNNLPIGNYTLVINIPYGNGESSILQESVDLVNNLEMEYLIKVTMLNSSTGTPPVIIPDSNPVPASTTTTIDSSTSTTLPPSGSGSGTKSTTTTTLVFYNCKIDPSCSSNKESIQLCPLICTKK